VVFCNTCRNQFWRKTFDQPPRGITHHQPRPLAGDPD
jgi:hypothetical protein